MSCAEALTAAGLVGEELGVPVFLYGELATRPEQRERADIRRGGPAALGRRIEAGELVPDFGPRRAHPTAGAVLASARPPLIAFNIDLATGDVELAKSIAAELRESGGGLPGVRSRPTGTTTAPRRGASSWRASASARPWPRRS